MDPCPQEEHSVMEILSHTFLQDGMHQGSNITRILWRNGVEKISKEMQRVPGNIVVKIRPRWLHTKCSYGQYSAKEERRVLVNL